jgi:hypothetical protein
LTQYLALADQLKLGPGSTVAVSEMTSQFPVPPGLGKVSVNYVVRYNDAAVRAAFLQYDVNVPAQKSLLETYTRETARLLISAYFTGKTNNVEPALGFAYSSTNVYQLYLQSGSRDNFVGNTITVTFPSWFARQGPPQSLTKLQKNVLYTFYLQENELVERLTKLFKVVGDSNRNNVEIPEAELKEAAKGFLAMSDDLNKSGGPTTFFAVFDKFVQKAAAPDAERKSTMIIEITPPNAKTLPLGGKEKVVKFFPA